MKFGNLDYQKIKSDYLKYLHSQEVMSEPFRDKLKQLKKFFLPISNIINEEHIKDKKVKIIGITGGQGSGKSTISNILKIILKKMFNLNTVIFSIDDFYKTLKDRKKMSLKISPLFLTRGVPGTHDTKLLLSTIKKLKKSKFDKVNIPIFDKSIDNRLPKKYWQSIKEKPDIIIFEGWCIGAKAQNNRDLLIPINKLEKEKDKNSTWRHYVNNKLKKEYSKIFKLIDKLIFLKVPSFKKVYEWRLLQEKKLRTKSRGNKIMNDNEVKNFIMFYERLTRHMLNTMTKKSDVIVKIDSKHKLKSINFN
tara:strand:+ start:453 stop:1370 length:918 start_codon:yes stop_codon:yes gene_type:complete